MEHKRAQWGSNLGFLLSAIGSAVGLGNIWGFPYKMGKSGGFTFLVVYLLLAVFVGFTIMITELSLSRRTGLGIIGTYNKVSKKFKWVGWLGVFSPFIILSFYSVLGGYCVEYIFINMANLFNGGDALGLTGSDLFGAMLTDPLGCLGYTTLFIVIGYFIVRGGIEKGIEKFNKIGMPALFVMLLIIIARSVTLPQAAEGLKFMFVPGYAVQAGFIPKAPSVLTVLATAGGQMFFSLSLAMGIMFTMGSYMSKDQNIAKNSLVIVVADTIAAILAGVAVIPAAVSNGIQTGVALSDIKLSGPSLLFVTLQDVFHAMGPLGSLFGVIFYLLVFVAAVSSSISLTEVIVTVLLDSAQLRGKTAHRGRVTLGVSLAILSEAALVAVDGLGSNGLWVPGQATFGINNWNDCWLDFMDFWSEGLAMPIGALLMAIMIIVEVKPKYVLEELHIGYSNKLDKFYSFCITCIVPIVMILILAGQLNDFLQLGWFV